MRTGTIGRLLLAGMLATGVSSAAKAQALSFAGEEIANASLMAAAKKEGKILYYGTFPESAFKRIADAFTKDSGIPITYLRLTTQKLFPRVTAEHSAGKLEADIIDLTDLTLVKELVDAGILASAHKVPSFDKIDRALRDDQGRWYAFFRPTSTIVVNSAIVKPEDFPKSYKDVLDPKWAGKIGMPSIDAGGSSFSNYMYLRDVIGADYWQKLAALKPRIYPSIIPTTTDLIRGETLLIVGGAEPAIQQIPKGAPVKVLFPVEGISSFPISGGVVASAKNANAAKVMINWLLSKHGGDAVARVGAYGSHPDSATPDSNGVKFPPASKVWNIPLSEWLKKREAYSKEWRALFTGGK